MPPANDYQSKLNSALLFAVHAELRLNQVLFVEDFPSSLKTKLKEAQSAARAASDAICALQKEASGE